MQEPVQARHAARDRRVHAEAARDERLVRRPQLRPARRGERAPWRRGRSGRTRSSCSAPALPLWRWYWRAILIAASVASEPLESCLTTSYRPPRHADQLGRELERAVGRRHDRRGEREPAMLGGDRVDDLVVAVPEADREDAREPVDVAPARVVREPDPAALDHDERVLGERLHLVEVDHHVPDGLAEVERLGVGVRGLGHGGKSCFVRPTSQARTEPNPSSTR